MSRTCFKTFFPNKEIKWKCIYLMLHRVTIDTNLCIFQYKILNKVLYLNEKLFKFKIVSSPLCSFCNLKDETPINLFYSRNQTKSLWSKFKELLNSEILPPQKKHHRVLSLALLIKKKILKSLTFCFLYLSIICLNKPKTKNKKNKKAYTRKPIKINEIYCKGCLGRGGKENILI